MIIPMAKPKKILRMHAIRLLLFTSFLLFIPVLIPSLPPNTKGLGSPQPAIAVKAVRTERNDNFIITPFEIAPTSRRFRLDTKKSAGIEIDVPFSPQWQVLVDRRPTMFTQSKSGFIQLSVPKGQTEIELLWQLSTVQKCIKIVICLASISLLTTTLILWLQNQNHRRVAALITASTVISLLLAELATRIFIGDPFATACVRPDKILHHALIPNKTCSYSFLENSSPTGKITIKINKLGLRDNEIQVPKPKGTYRILMLGDSSTAGLNVELEETSTKQLEALLHTHYEERNIEVINAGVSSYSPLLEYLYLREQGFKLEPDLVILNFDPTDVADLANHYHQAKIEADGTIIGVSEIYGNKSILKKIHHLLVNRSILYGHYLQFTLIRAANWFNKGGTSQTYYGQFEGDLLVALREKVQPSEDILWLWPKKSLKLMSALTREHHIPLILTIYPFPPQVNGKEWQAREAQGFKLGKVYPTRNLETIESIAKQMEIPVVNMLDAFRTTSLSPLFFATDYHFTPNGHRLFAEELFRYLSTHEAEIGLATSK